MLSSVRISARRWCGTSSSTCNNNVNSGTGVTKSSSRDEDALYNVKDKVALVVGGTQGIGYASAVELLRSGALHVALAGRNRCQGNAASKALKSTFGYTRCSYIQLDVRDDTAYTATFERVCREFGGLHVVVNSAGVVDGKNWQREMSTNANAAIRGTLLALEHMNQPNTAAGPGGTGVVVNVAGVMGVEALPGGATLAASKHAVVGLCRSLGSADLLRRTGVRILALCPGFTVNTRQGQCMMERALDPHHAHQLQQYWEKAPKQRPECCGKAALHLVKHARTGSIWVVEAGRLYLINMPPRNCYYSLQAQFM